MVQFFFAAGSVVLSLLGTTGQTTPLTAPIGLAAGSPYQLIFVSGGTPEGPSADQCVYSSFVSDEAALKGGLPVTTWRSITTVVTCGDRLLPMTDCGE